jgi:peptidyl-prolyl cis-trans isomerase B (cyclophilin B)
MTRRFFAAVFTMALLFGTIGTITQATAAEGRKSVKITTNMGTISVELFAKEAPKTVANFLAYVKAGHYSGTVFHRVIAGFMVQGGGFNPGMSQKDTNANVDNEADNGLRNEVGTLAMARTSDPHSASAQFFINTADNVFLNHSDKSARGWGYAVFGKVTDGMDVVRKIEATPTGQKSGFGDVPVEDVIIEKIEE